MNFQVVQWIDSIIIHGFFGMNSNPKTKSSLILMSFHSPNMPSGLCKTLKCFKLFKHTFISLLQWGSRRFMVRGVGWRLWLEVVGSLQRVYLMCVQIEFWNFSLCSFLFCAIVKEIQAQLDVCSTANTHWFHFIHVLSDVFFSFAKWVVLFLTCQSYYHWKGMREREKLRMVWLVTFFFWWLVMQR